MHPRSYPVLPFQHTDRASKTLENHSIHIVLNILHYIDDNVLKYILQQYLKWEDVRAFMLTCRDCYQRCFKVFISCSLLHEKYFIKFPCVSSDDIERPWHFIIPHSRETELFHHLGVLKFNSIQTLITHQQRRQHINMYPLSLFCNLETLTIDVTDLNTTLLVDNIDPHRHISSLNCALLPRNLKKIRWYCDGCRLENISRFPDRLVTLDIDCDTFNAELHHLPSTLQHLCIVSRSFDQPLSRLPAKLHTLELRSSHFNQPLNQLPHALTSLVLDSPFFQYDLDHLPTQNLEFLNIGVPLLSDLDCLPDCVTHLIVRGESLETGLYHLPLGLRVLRIYSSYNLPVEMQQLRCLEELYLGPYFNQPLTTLPCSLKCISLDKRFNQPLNPLPPNLEKLTFSEKSTYNHPLPTAMASNLNTLILGPEFNRMLDLRHNTHLETLHVLNHGRVPLNRDSIASTLPITLRELYIFGLFNHTLDHMHIYSNLIKLVLPNTFNQSISGKLPSRLEILHLGNCFQQPLGKLPMTLKHLKIHSDYFNYSLSGLPEGLKTLDLRLSYFNQPLNHLPESLESLRMRTFHFKLDIDHLPSRNLSHLALYIYGNETAICCYIPESVEVLELGGDLNPYLPIIFNHKNTTHIVPLDKTQSHRSMRVELGRFFNRPLLPYTMPFWVTSLVLGDTFNQPIPYGALPSLLEYLSLGNRFNHPILHVVVEMEFLHRIVISNHEYTHPLPEKSKYLYIEYQ